MAERYQLQGAAALVRIADDHTVPFRLLNPTSQPVTLRKGATLGTFSEAYGESEVLKGSVTDQLNQRTLDSVPFDLENSALSSEEQSRLRELLNCYRNIFAVHPDELGRTNIIQHYIETGDHPPIRSRPYQVPHAQKEAIEI